MVTSRITKRNVAAFLLDYDNNSDNDDKENQDVLNNNLWNFIWVNLIKYLIYIKVFTKWL